MPCDDRGKVWDDTAAKQRKPGTDCHHQKLEGAMKESTQSQGAWPGWHLDGRHLASKTLKEFISVVLSTQFVTFCYGNTGKLIQRVFLETQVTVYPLCFGESGVYKQEPAGEKQLTGIPTLDPPHP